MTLLVSGRCCWLTASCTVGCNLPLGYGAAFTGQLTFISVCVESWLLGYELYLIRLFLGLSPSHRGLWKSSVIKYQWCGQWSETLILLQDCLRPIHLDLALVLKAVLVVLDIMVLNLDHLLLFYIVKNCGLAWTFVFIYLLTYLLLIELSNYNCFRYIIQMMIIANQLSIVDSVLLVHRLAAKSWSDNSRHDAEWRKQR